MTALNIAALAAKAAAEGKDMNTAQTGGSGGDYTPPEAGATWLRLVAYIEVGNQEETVMGKAKVRPTAIFTFELSGPKHEPKDVNGEKVPHRISIELPISLNEKAHFYKLFRALNYAGKATHAAQLVGSAYKGVVMHHTYKGRDGKDRVYADLKDRSTGSFTISSPHFQRFDEEGNPVGEPALKNVAPAITPLKLFLWEYADKAQWDSIHIDGEYPARTDGQGNVVSPARSKNVYQNKIKAAKNFKGSPIQILLAGGGAGLDIPDSEQAGDAPVAADDALNAAARQQPSLGM